jgi:hypothetical protein
MQCLRCSNEALPGKALCASCFAAHQKKAEFEETDEWVQQQLESTRSESRGRQREAKGSQTSLQSLTLTLAPALLAMGGLLMLSVWAVNNLSFSFTPTPESEQGQGGPTTSGGQNPGEPNKAPVPAKRQPAPPAQQPGDKTENQIQQAPPTPTVQPTATPVNTATPTNTPTATPTTTAKPLA